MIHVPLVVKVVMGKLVCKIERSDKHSENSDISVRVTGEYASAGRCRIELSDHAWIEQLMDARDRNARRFAEMKRERRRDLYKGNFSSLRNEPPTYRSLFHKDHVHIPSADASDSLPSYENVIYQNRRPSSV